ncbi:MAG: response regulator [Paracoccaceae bacterium]|nr:response regulator [Paracoccaceae bacterium]
MPQPPLPGYPPLFLPAEPAAMAQAQAADRPGMPLLGLTVLAVEDSRFTCDALRLLCQRLGARLRRAETLKAARAHLKLYRPDVVIIDLGLPDGRGEVLIRDLAMQGASCPLILGTSGDPSGRAAALAAGAVGFLEKPLESLAAFRATILHHLPERGMDNAALSMIPARTPPAPSEVKVSPDPLALRDDLNHAAGMIAAGPDAGQRRYLAGFLSGLGRSAHDAALENAAHDATGPAGFERLSGLVTARIEHAPDAIDSPVETARLAGLPR